MTIWFEGTNAHKVDFVKFFADFAATFDYKDPADPKKGVGQPNLQTLTYPVEGVGPVTTSADPKKYLTMKWYLDTGDAYTTKDNAYIRRAEPNLVALFDLPLHDRTLKDLLNKFPFDKNPALATLDSQTFFLTYAVADGKALAVVAWRSQGTLHRPKPEVDTQRYPLMPEITLPANEKVLNLLLGVYKKQQPQGKLFIE